MRDLIVQGLITAKHLEVYGSGKLLNFSETLSLNFILSSLNSRVCDLNTSNEFYLSKGWSFM